MLLTVAGTGGSRFRRGGLCLLVALWTLACLVAGARAQSPSPQLQQLRLQLQQADELPYGVESAARLSLLRNLQPPPGSAEELEQLFLLATTHDAPAVSEARWSQWRQTADASQGALLERVRALARAYRAWQLERYREALDFMPPATTEELPPVWRMRENLLRADILEENGDPQNAVLLRLGVASLVDAVAPPARQALALASLAYTYSRLGQLELSQTTMQEALQRMGPAPSLSVRGRMNNFHALVLDRLGRHRESRVALELALQDARRANDQDFIATLLGNLSDAYLKESAWPRALKAADEAYQLAVDLQKPGSISLALHNRGIAKIQLGRVAEGKADVRQSVAQELQRGGQTSAAEGLVELGEALEKAGDLPGALEAFHEYRDLADAQVRIDRREAIREAQAKAEEKRREREQAQRAQKNQADAAVVESQRLRIWLGVLGIACGAALLAVITLLYRRLRRTNALLADTNRDLAARTEVDPLTGLGNRRRVERLARRHTRDGVLRAGLMLVDIDHFKQVNDQHGHAAGDVVLQAVAGRLRAALREDEGEGVVRWGGEEFLILLPGADGALMAALAKRVLNDLSSTPVALRDGGQLAITASLGAAAFPEAAPEVGCNAERAVAVVDALMYVAKLRGRNQAWQLMSADASTAEGLMELLQDPEAANTAGHLRLRRHSAQGEASA